MGVDFYFVGRGGDAERWTCSTGAVYTCLCDYQDTDSSANAEQEALMTSPRKFSAEARDSLRESFRNGEALECPDCKVPLDRRRVPPRSDVSYVRDRLVVTCPLCHGHLVLDRREPR